MNTIAVSKSGITVTCLRGDTATQEQVMQFYPVHQNRIRTKLTSLLARCLRS